jgi:hypothetical protein
MKRGTVETEGADCWRGTYRGWVDEAAASHAVGALEGFGTYAAAQMAHRQDRTRHSPDDGSCEGIPGTWRGRRLAYGVTTSSHSQVSAIDSQSSSGRSALVQVMRWNMEPSVK